MKTFKTHFIQLFEYDWHANLQIFQLFMSIVDSTEMPRNLLSHLLGSQNIWLSRCKKQVNMELAIWPQFTNEELKEAIENNHRKWIGFLSSLQTNDFSETIIYQNSKGESFQNSLTDILTHVINHGTHHRAQVGQLLKLAGIDHLPGTDYILFIRENNN